MPRVWRQDPSIPCLLVGGKTPNVVSRLACDRVEILGHVPDLGSIFDRVRLTVAPLRFGAGLKGKVVGSLAAGVPCVSTPVAAEGMALPPLLSSLVGRDAHELAHAVLLLHTDEAKNALCAAAGADYVQRMFSGERIDDLMRTALLETSAEFHRPMSSNDSQSGGMLLRLPSRHRRLGQGL